MKNIVLIVLVAIFVVFKPHNMSAQDMAFYRVTEASINSYDKRTGSWLGWEKSSPYAVEQLIIGIKVSNYPNEISICVYRQDDGSYFTYKSSGKISQIYDGTYKFLAVFMDDKGYYKPNLDEVTIYFGYNGNDIKRLEFNTGTVRMVYSGLVMSR